MAVQLFARRAPEDGADTEAVAPPAGYDVQVRVEDLLARHLAVREEEVDPLGCHRRRPDRRGEPLGHPEHVGTVVRVETGEVRRVTLRDHQEVPSARLECFRINAARK